MRRDSTTKAEVSNPEISPGHCKVAASRPRLIKNNDEISVPVASATRISGRLLPRIVRRRVRSPRHSKTKRCRQTCGAGRNGC